MLKRMIPYISGFLLKDLFLGLSYVLPRTRTGYLERNAFISYMAGS